jgi:hypothetical protein
LLWILLSGFLISMVSCATQADCPANQMYTKKNVKQNSKAGKQMKLF